MSNEQSESTIVWKLPREEKGQYVAASRREGKTLIAWLTEAAREHLKKEGTGGRTQEGYHQGGGGKGSEGDDPPATP